MSLYLDLLEKALTGTLYDDPPADPWNGKTEQIGPGGGVRISPGPYNPKVREYGRDWPSNALTMIGTRRLRNLRECAEYCVNYKVPGDFIETGVWRGGACILLAGVLEDLEASEKFKPSLPNYHYYSSPKKVWVCDSFEGLPKPTYEEEREDKHFIMNVALAVSQEQVEANFARFGLLSPSVRFVKGWFKDSLREKIPPETKFSIIRLDGDMYGSTKDAIEALYDRLSENGFLIVDDYYAVRGCKKAIDEFRASRKISDETSPVMEIDGCGIYWQK